MMRLHPAICPQCSANLDFSENSEIAICTHCKTKIFIEKEQGNSVNFEGLLKLAKVAEVSGNFGEAYDLYSQALVLNLHSVDAWRGKGYSAGMLSNLISDRLKETIIYYNQSLAVADANDLAHLNMEYALSAFRLARSYFDLSLKHTMEFIGVRDAQFEHADRCRNIIELCEYALSLDSDLSTAKAFINDIASRCEKINFLDYNSKMFFVAKKEKYRQNRKVENSISKRSDFSGGAFLLIIGGLVVNYFIATNFMGVKNAIFAFFTAFILFIPEAFIFGWGIVGVFKLFKSKK